MGGTRRLLWRQVPEQTGSWGDQQSGDKSPQGGQSPGLFLIFLFVCLLVLLVPAITPWFVHSLELGCHDFLCGGSCEEPPTCKRWMWNSATGVGVWCAPCQTLEEKAAIEMIKGDIWNSSSGSSGFLHHRSKCLLQHWGSSVTLMKAKYWSVDSCFWFILFFFFFSPHLFFLVW